MRTEARAGATLPAIAAAAIALAAGCVSAIVPRPSEADARRARRSDPTADLAGLSRGRELYVRRCSGCHSLHPPTAIAAAQWPGVLEDMGPRARLHAGERRTVELYLVTIAAAEPREGDLER